MILQAVHRDQCRQRRLVALSLPSKGPCVRLCSAAMQDVVAGEDGVEGKQRGGGVRAGGGGGIFGCLGKS